MPRKTPLPLALLTATALALGAASCGTPATDSASTPTAASPGSSLDSAALSLTDGWAKAGTSMTGAFGTLSNATGSAITITTARSDAAARTELHTMAKQPDGTMKMVQKAGGFTVPAHGTARLVPGGDHIMLIGLSKPLENGDQVRVTLTSSTGQSFEWTIPVRSFAGADEKYLPGATSTGMAH